MMANEVRLIDAFTLAEEIESLNITVAGKPARWNDAKHSVLRTIAEQKDIGLESLRPKGRVVLKERNRGGFQVVTGTDEFGNEHTVRIDTRSSGKEPYCSECGAALADSFRDYCPRCGAKMEG